jgi:polysaccharide deacetylase family protein (PEP-CTERM system associated)
MTVGQPTAEKQQHSGPHLVDDAERVVNALSVDVEDYFHVAAFDDIVPRRDWDGFEPRVEQNCRWLLEFLQERDLRATFFVLGWVGERRPELVREIHRAGHEVASHGYDHRRVTTQTPQEFRADVARAKKILEDAIGVEVIGYRAPTYSIVRETLWALDVILEEGYRYDSSIFPIHHDLYGIPDSRRFPWVVREQGDARLWEFPISTGRMFGLNFPFIGGGYTRILPWWFVRWSMRRLNAGECQPAMVYIHPWEIDPGQPRLEAARMLSRVRHYHNLGQTRERLRRLVDEFRFDTVRGVLKL